jgi:hypothetical protein
MARFRIRDLMVSLDAAGRRAAPEQRHHNLAQADVPCAATANPLGCPHSYNIVIADGESPGTVIDQAPRDALPRLRDQLQALLEQVESRLAE